MNLQTIKKKILHTPFLLAFLACTQFCGSVRSDQVWDGDGTNDKYSNALNWEGNSLPSHEERIILQEAGGTILVEPGDNFVPRKIIGPTSDAAVTTTMNFTGGALTNTSYWIVAPVSGGVGIINVTGSSCDIYTRDLALGQNGGTGELNLSNGLIEVYGTGAGLGLIVPGDSGNSSTGRINITGGALYAGQLTMSSGGSIDVSKNGALVLAGDKRTLVNGHISAGRITAEQGLAGVNVKYMNGETTVFSPGLAHVVVTPQPPNPPYPYYGWPANEGIWIWGNHIVVGFNRGVYEYHPQGHQHSADPITIMQAYSGDGGKTWSLEYPSTFADGAPLQPSHPQLNFTAAGFGFKMRKTKYWYTYNEGLTWSGPYAFPQFGIPENILRTDYIVNSSTSMKLFLTRAKEDGIEGRPSAAETTNGCLNFTDLGWMAPSPPTYMPVDDERKYFCVMPSTVKIDANTYVTCLRQRRLGENWLEIRKSTNGGSTWTYVSTPTYSGGPGIQMNNPGSLIKLQDGRLCLTYGWRSEPNSGIRAKMSSDNGTTWSSEIVLRNDGLNTDIGYPRSVQRPDGRIVTVYYYATSAIPQQHIAATIWIP